VGKKKRNKDLMKDEGKGTPESQTYNCKALRGRVGGKMGKNFSAPVVKEKKGERLGGGEAWGANKDILLRGANWRGNREEE